MVKRTVVKNLPKTENLTLRIAPEYKCLLDRLGGAQAIFDEALKEKLNTASKYDEKVKKKLLEVMRFEPHKTKKEL